MKAATRAGNGKIDWAEVRQRLARIEDAFQEATRLSSEQAAAVMTERARALARVPPVQPKATEVVEVATFTLAGEQFAIDTRHVCEVTRFLDLTPVPGAPDSFAGLLNLRGEILAVFDLRKFFGLAGEVASALARIIVFGEERVEFGAVADAVGEVQSVRIDELYESPSTFASIGREFVRGVTNRGLIVLDADRMLRSNRFYVDQPEDVAL